MVPSSDFSLMVFAAVTTIINNNYYSFTEFNV